ncbi:putative hnhc nuclease [Caudoviricetes sp.]|nr:putative hnhc nuclease [Caudoviricetes sp.]
MIKESQKQRARHLAHKFIAIKPCEVCGTDNKVHRHHDDYSKPLQVRFLCPKHHKAIHDPRPQKYNKTPLKVDTTVFIKQRPSYSVKSIKHITQAMRERLLTA